MIISNSCEPTRFQSTLPARGATGISAVSPLLPYYFNPRSPHGERRWRMRLACRSRRISIHAPRTGSDTRCFKCFAFRRKFQSTLPARGATCTTPSKPTPARYFNPRSPHGERRLYQKRPYTYQKYFNPRSPHGERHVQRLTQLHRPPISIHAPRTGSDGGTTALGIVPC